MSIINSDGLNTNWQLNVLRGLQGINDQLATAASVVPAPIVPITILPHILISAGESSTLITVKTTSISFASNGTAEALVTFDGGSTIVSLPIGTTVNMDAPSGYAENLFGYDTATNPGSSLIITYNEIA